jgi:hypothetical protein
MHREFFHVLHVNLSQIRCKSRKKGMFIRMQNKMRIESINSCHVLYIGNEYLCKYDITGLYGRGGAVKMLRLIRLFSESKSAWNGFEIYPELP